MKKPVWLEKHPWLLNRYFITSITFLVWMGFFDSSSLLMHWELSEEIERLEEGIDFYAKELESDQQKLHLLQSDPEHLEKFAREEYWLCREGEEVFLVELTADPDQ